MNKMKKVRQDKGFTQKELSQSSGIPLRTIQDYEQGRRDIQKASAKALFSLANSLDCKISDFTTFR